MRSAGSGFVIVSLLLVCNAFDARAGSRVLCGDSAPECGGACGALEVCVPVSSGGTTSGPGPACVCVPDFDSLEYCGDADPQCGGQCGDGFDCLPASEIFPTTDQSSVQGGMGSEPCFCFPSDFCGVVPECGGDCSQGLICRPLAVGGATDGDERGGAVTQSESPPTNLCTCQEPTPAGGCCLPNLSCQELSEFECSQAGGFFAGEGVACTASLCTNPGTYDSGECASPFEDISASGTALAPTDDGGEVAALGFSFSFYSQIQTSIGISSNGFLSFAANLSTFSETAIPNPNSPNNLIAPLWDDLNPTQGGDVRYQTLGSAPNRRFVAQWTAVPEFVNDGANTFQAVLFESSNAIEFRYGTLSLVDGSIGVENSTGLVGTSIPRASVGPGDCVRLTPGRAALGGPAEAPALGKSGLAIGVLLLLGVALSHLWRVDSLRRS